MNKVEEFFETDELTTIKVEETPLSDKIKYLETHDMLKDEDKEYIEILYKSRMVEHAESVNAYGEVE